MIASPPDPDRVLGCLLAGAVGDALGRPIEGLSLADIRRTHGGAGVTGYTGRPPGAFGEATQLSLCTAQGVFQASVRERAKGIGGAFFGILQRNYLAWLTGQGDPIPEQGLYSGGRAAHVPALAARRGVGRTTLGALRAAAQRRRPGVPLGTPTEPINDSKGAAGIVRTAPCGFARPDAAFEYGQGAAALTHGHPSGHLPAGALAAAVSALVRGAGLADAVEGAMARLRRHPRHHETTKALEAAVALARSGPPAPEELERLGHGFTAPEALAIAVCAALGAEAAGGHPLEIVPRGLLLAVNHSGDSDTTGSLCGNLLGARYGPAAVPEHWRAGVEALDLITDLARDLAIELGPKPPTSGGWGEPPYEWHVRYGA